MARDFTGNTANYLQVGDVSEIDITGTAITVSCWVQLDAVTLAQGLVTKFNASGSRQYGLEISASPAKADFVVSDGTNSTVCAGATTLTAGPWYHICGVQTSTDVFVYLNGAQDGTHATQRTLVNTTALLQFGKYQTAGFPFDGRLAEIAIWNVSLSATEVAALAAGYPASGIQAANLRGYWQLKGESSPEPDTSGNSNNATINGTVNAANGPPIKVGGAGAGLVGTGADAVVFTETGRGIAGLIGSGSRVYTGSTTYPKVGHAVVGLVGSGPKDHSHPGSTYTKAGRGTVGLTCAERTSEFHQDVVPRGISIAFGANALEPYPTWTRIDQ